MNCPSIKYCLFQYNLQLLIMNYHCQWNRFTIVKTLIYRILPGHLVFPLSLSLSTIDITHNEWCKLDECDADGPLTNPDCVYAAGNERDDFFFFQAIAATHAERLQRVILFFSEKSRERTSFCAKTAKVYNQITAFCSIAIGIERNMFVPHRSIG